MVSTAEMLVEDDLMISRLPCRKEMRQNVNVSESRQQGVDGRGKQQQQPMIV